MPQNAQNQTRRPVVEALVHDVLNRERFTTIADLSDAVKSAAARLRIPYTGDEIANALRSVSARRSLVVEPPRPPVEHPRPSEPRSWPPLDPDVAAKLADLGGAVKSFPAPPPQPDTVAQARAADRVAYLAERRRRPIDERLDAILSQRKDGSV